jgi:cytochrome c oxidase subunit 2
MFSFLIYFIKNTKKPFSQIGFKDPATSLMENILDLHHFIFYFIIIISGLVLWLLIQIIDNFIYIYSIRRDPSIMVDRVIFYILISLASKARFFRNNRILETIWTLAPVFVLLIVSLPSFYMLYLSEEGIRTYLTIKAVGFQWYWTYDYTDFFPFWYNFLDSTLDYDDYIIESYIERTQYLNLSKGDFRLLETDDILILPVNVHLRLIVTSLDTLHSFSVPNLGIKIDAIPGRLNKMDIYIYRMGVFYGQCSEICGVGHGFMPINIYVVSFLNLLIGPKFL